MPNKEKMNFVKGIPWLKGVYRVVDNHVGIILTCVPMRFVFVDIGIFIIYVRTTKGFHFGNMICDKSNNIEDAIAIFFELLLCYKWLRSPRDAADAPKQLLFYEA